MDIAVEVRSFEGVVAPRPQAHFRSPSGHFGVCGTFRTVVQTILEMPSRAAQQLAELKIVEVSQFNTRLIPYVVETIRKTVDLSTYIASLSDG